MVVKRRNVWLSDDTWAKLDKIAEGKASRSQVIAEIARFVDHSGQIMRRLRSTDRSPDWPLNVEAARATLHPVDVPRITPDRRRVDVDSGQSRRREDQEKIQALSGPPTLAKTRRMRAAAAKAFGQFRPAPKPGKR